MLEDVNSMLNTADVANLYIEKDFEEIADACRGECIRKNL